MAIVLTCYYRPKPGGFCTRLFRAIRALMTRGHTVHYLAVAPFPIDHPRCVFHRFPWPAAYSDTLLFWALFHALAPLMLLGIALRHRVTHAFVFGPTYAFLMRPTLWAAHVVLTCFLRGDPILSHRLQGKPRWIVFLDQCIEGLAIQGVRVVGVSLHLTHTLLKRHPNRCPSQSAILANDLPLGRVATSRLWNTPLRLAMVGILEPMKNHAFILRLLKEYSKRGWHLFVYGMGPEARRLAVIANQSNLAERVSFMGWVPGDSLWPQVDLLLSASIHEGMPNAMLEAIAAGVPVLASDIPAHREILPCDQLLPLKDAKQWRSALDNILAAPQHRLPAMVDNQRRSSAHLRFDWDAEVVRMILGDVL
jgi:glycosyltransferase involved in cell wall biosynthesis